MRLEALAENEVDAHLQRRRAAVIAALAGNIPPIRAALR
jgi:hypothetical protein